MKAIRLVSTCNFPFTMHYVFKRLYFKNHMFISLCFLIFDILGGKQALSSVINIRKN